VLKVVLESEDDPPANLYLDAGEVRRITALEPKVISITGRFRPARRAVEHFIEQSFARAYGSKIQTHYPTLMSVRDASGDILAAAGFRSADKEDLFLEQYLSVPIEQAIGDAAGSPPERAKIAEIGSLASRGKGAAAVLFIVLAAYLRQGGFEYATATATGVLRRTFSMFGFEMQELGRASTDRLRDGPADWGSYYATDPKVIAGAIAPCFERLERFLPADHNAAFGKLFPRLHHRV